MRIENPLLTLYRVRSIQSREDFSDSLGAMESEENCGNWGNCKIKLHIAYYSIHTANVVRLANKIEQRAS